MGEGVESRGDLLMVASFTSEGTLVRWNSMRTMTSRKQCLIDLQYRYLDSPSLP